MKIKRIVSHLAMTGWQVRRLFRTRILHAIEVAVREGEQLHSGQIRFAVEGALHSAALFHGQSARERAIEVFSLLHVWDTEHNNGVLIYLLLADHDVEIVVDRGIHAKVSTREWEHICHAMETAFRQGRYEEGAVDGIRAVARLLAAHFPVDDRSVNELPDRPVIL